MSLERKDEVVKMLQAQLGSTYKKNSVAQYLDQLLARELEEAENPNLAQKRVLEGTLLEDLACPRKRHQGAPQEQHSAADSEAQQLNLSLLAELALCAP